MIRSSRLRSADGRGVRSDSPRRGRVVWPSDPPQLAFRWASAFYATARPGSTAGAKRANGSTSAIGARYSALGAAVGARIGAVLQGIIDLRRTWGRIRLLRGWSSLVRSRSHGKYRRFAAISGDQERSWVAARPETWVGVGWRDGGGVHGRHGHRRPACGEGRIRLASSVGGVSLRGLD